MNFDPRAPKSLVHMQKWFAGIITKPLDEEHSRTIAEESPSYISERAQALPHERMEIYNNSYWLRLLGVLHEEYPFLTRLFGKDSFNKQIGIPYLLSFPPRHWSLNKLGKDLVDWLKKAYRAEDKPLIELSAQIDWACQQCFFAQKKSPLPLDNFAGDNAEKLLSIPLSLQPDLFLIQAWGHFINYRDAFLKEEPEYWEDNDFPELVKDKTYYFVIFRNAKFAVRWDEIQKEEYLMLQLLEQGLSIQDAAERVQELPGVSLELIENECAIWVQKWLLYNFLYAP